MGVVAAGYYREVRKAVGLPYMANFKQQPAVPAAPPAEIDALLNRSQPIWLALVGFGGLALLAWLMMVKPF